MQKHRFNIFPKADPEDFAAIVADMKEHGYDATQPVVVYQGAVLDGWNRWLAAKDAEVTAVTRQFHGTDEEALTFTLRTNKRRNMTSSQRAAYAAEAEEIFAEIQANTEETRRVKQAEAAKEQHRVSNPRAGESSGSDNYLSEPKTAHKSDAATKTAEIFNTNRTYVSDAQKLKKESPEVFQKVLSGEKSIPEAKREIKLEERKKKIEANLKNDIGPTKPIITKCDAVKFLETVQPFDLLITDPPYSTDVPDIKVFAASWLPLALSKMKPTGRAYICIGAYPEELAAYLNLAMPAQVLVWTYRNTLGPTPKDNYKLNWQAILYYKGEQAEALDCPVMLEQFSVQDINAPDGRLGDRYHAWQKPMELADRFIRHSTKPGDFVVDCFACTGTFLLSAAKLGRTATGCDISAENIAIAKQRGCHESIG